jgi:hypothetical protein
MRTQRDRNITKRTVPKAPRARDRNAARHLIQVSDLTAMAIKDVRQEWRRAFGTEPPASFNTDLLRRAIADHIQRGAEGGLSKRHARDLRALVLSQMAGATNGFDLPPPGTRLSRVRHGVTHNVTVLEDNGFEYQGRRYGSLSAISREITGTTWSGPRFFGLLSTRNSDA